MTPAPSGGHSVVHFRWRVIPIAKTILCFNFASTQIMFGKTSKPNVIHMEVEKHN